MPVLSRSFTLEAPVRLGWRLPPVLPPLRRLWRLSAGLIVPLAALALWQASASTGWLPPQVLPAPQEVLSLLLAMAASGELWEHTAISLLRVAGGFALGAAAGLALGIAMGVSRRVEACVGPLFTAVAQIPPLGWVPLLMMLVGIDNTLKVLVIAKAAFIPLVVNTVKGIRSVPVAHLEVGRVFGFGPWTLLTRVILRAAVPPIFTGVRNGMTNAWLALVAVELLASSEGLGYLMLWGRQLFQLDLVLVAILVVGTIGFVLDRVLEVVEARLQRWRLVEPGAEGRA